MRLDLRQSMAGEAHVGHVTDSPIESRRVQFTSGRSRTGAPQQTVATL